MCLTGGNISKTARVSVVRQNLKEAECKMLARRTGSAYEAHPEGKAANLANAPSLYGIRLCRCDGYKQESCAHYPGRSSLYLPEVRESARGETRDGNIHWTVKKSAEAIVPGGKGRT